MYKSKWFSLLLLIFLFLFVSSASAFSDIEGTVQKNVALELQERGILQGVNSTQFAPHKPLTYAETVTLFVKTFNLSIDHIKFIKEPVITDYYDNIKKDAWYAGAFLNAYHNGLQFPRDIKPESPITREEFVHHLSQLVLSTGDYILLEIWHMYDDLDDVTEAYRGSINTLLTMGIIELSDENKFLPKQKITRMDAALMIFNAIKYIEKHKSDVVLPVEPVENVDVYTERVNDEVIKVTIDWGEQPNPGYSVTIDKIEFIGTDAVIHYTLNTPDPNMMYPQVITRAKVSTYLDAKYIVKTIASQKASGESIKGFNPNQAGSLNVENVTSGEAKENIEGGK